MFFTVLYIQHVLACAWIYLGNAEERGWLEPYLDRSNFQNYIQCFYFIVATMTTVGYGDMSGQN